MIGISGKILDSTDYRRQARRLRHLHADNPTHLHRALRLLADAHDRQNPPPVAQAAQPYDGTGPAPRAHATDPRQQFADAVAHAIARQPAVLPYSQRLELLNHAARLGIGRFDANLLIALVQHRLQHHPPDHHRFAPITTFHRARWRAPLLYAGAIATVQGAITAAALWLALG